MFGEIVERLEAIENRMSHRYRRLRVGLSGQPRVTQPVMT